MKAYIFEYYIKALSDSAFSKSFIAIDEDDAKRQFITWISTVNFKIEDCGDPQLIEDE